ncbi:MAG: MgtC/SapB family protein [Bacteroidaceae bacterium]|nr:MgtC/SapB family protein [Bacteroidaceae bacterium]
MLDYILEQINAPGINTIGSIFKLLLSLTLGATVGLERRHKGQIAGMRTFALITMGAALAMILSLYIPQHYFGMTKNGDPERIAAQVISGIGFLGAGAIIQMKGSVRGLTTAAGIWVSACIGLTVGAGLYLVSIVACATIIFVLLTFELCEKHLFRGGEMKIVRLKVGKILTDADTYRDSFRAFRVHISDEYLRYDYTHDTTIINFMVRSNSATDFIGLFNDLHAKGNVLSLTLTNEMNN